MLQYDVTTGIYDCVCLWLIYLLNARFPRECRHTLNNMWILTLLKDVYSKNREMGRYDDGMTTIISEYDS